MIRYPAMLLGVLLSLTACASAAAPPPLALPSPTPSESAAASAPPAASPTSSAKPKPQPSHASSPSAAGKPKGALIFDPFDKAICTWVPRMFVDLSGHSKPGIDLRIPVWASPLSSNITLTVRAELNGTNQKTSTTVNATAPEWRGVAHLAFSPPASGDFVSFAIELDPEGKLAGKTSDNSRRTLQGSLPNPRPTSDTAFTCTHVV